MEQYKGQTYLTVAEFAKLTGRFTNHIYVLITEGNSQRKLKTITLDGKYRIPESEIKDFPFNKSSVLQHQVDELQEQVELLVDRVQILENLLGEYPNGV